VSCGRECSNEKEKDRGSEGHSEYILMPSKKDTSYQHSMIRAIKKKPLRPAFWRGEVLQIRGTEKNRTKVKKGRGSGLLT